MEEMSSAAPAQHLHSASSVTVVGFRRPAANACERQSMERQPLRQVRHTWRPHSSTHPQMRWHAHNRPDMAPLAWVEVSEGSPCGSSEHRSVGEAAKLLARQARKLPVVCAGDRVDVSARLVDPGRLERCLTAISFPTLLFAFERSTCLRHRDPHERKCEKTLCFKRERNPRVRPPSHVAEQTAPRALRPCETVGLVHRNPPTRCSGARLTPPTQEQMVGHRFEESGSQHLAPCSALQLASHCIRCHSIPKPTQPRNATIVIASHGTCTLRRSTFRQANHARNLRLLHCSVVIHSTLRIATSDARIPALQLSS